MTEVKLRGLKTVRVSKPMLLETLQKNKEEHMGIYTEAVEGYWEKVEKAHNAVLIKIANRDKNWGFSYFPYPEDHSGDYECAIQLLEYSLDEEFELTEEEFNNFVMDNWKWQNQFLTSASSYGSITATNSPKFR